MLIFRTWNRDEITILSDTSASSRRPATPPELRGQTIGQSATLSESFLSSAPSVDSSEVRVSPAVSWQGNFNVSQLYRQILEAPTIEQTQALIEAHEGDYIDLLGKREIHEIIPGLFLSGYYEEGFAGGVQRFNSTRAILAQGEPLTFGAIIHVVGADDNGRQPFDQISAETVLCLDEAASEGRIGLNHFTENNLKKVVKLAIRSLIDEKPVLVHCMQGCDRSSAVVALILSVIFNFENNQAASNFIKSKRWIVNLYDSKLPYSARCDAHLKNIFQDSEIQGLFAEYHTKYSH